LVNSIFKLTKLLILCDFIKKSVFIDINTLYSFCDVVGLLSN
jgi:hypothetical protein